MLATVLNIASAVSLLLTSVCLIIIQQRYYSYSRFNARRLLYVTGAGGAFVFSVYLLGRTSPFFDPFLQFIPVQPAERVVAFVPLFLVLHLWSHLADSDHEHVRKTPLFPRELTFWEK